MSLSETDEAAGSRQKARVVLCFAHLRWNFVYQRPQHLLTRAAAHAKVFFFEEPVFHDAGGSTSEPSLRPEPQAGGVTVLTPMLPRGLSHAQIIDAQRALVDQFVAEHDVTDFIAWYYTPMALLFTEHLCPRVTVYDCMDQLSAFDGAPPEIVEQEQRLFERANVVFTGGRSLFEEKQRAHTQVHLFPSSVDYSHFAAARSPGPDPQDQCGIAHPRVGFFGVLDERLDRELLRDVAALDPTLQLIMIGPVVKIREEDLPRADNIHYLGKKEYTQLPHYLAHWEVAILPFALNASTHFISPTKTPEYLSAGKPVVSTPVRDVEEPYGRLGFARIAADAASFGAAIHAALEPPSPEWLASVDDYLRHTSWDATFASMWSLVIAATR